MGIGIVLPAVMSGCRSVPQAASTPVPTPKTAEVTMANEAADQATKLAEWVEAHQAHPRANNHWPEFVDAAARVGGAWEFFTAANPAIAGFVAADPDRNYPALDPLVLAGVGGGPRYEKLEPELHAFFGALNGTKMLFRLDDLAAPARFVALRATEPLITTSMPELGEARLAVKVCVARMRVMLKEGKPEQAVRSMDHALALARGVQGRGVLIGHLVAEACWSVVEREVCAGLVEGRLDGATALEMLEVLSKHELPDPRVAFGGERFFTLETLDRFFEKVKEEGRAPRPGGGAAGDDATNDKESGPVAPRDQQVAMANRFFDACERVFSASAEERANASAEIDAVLAITEQHGSGPAYVPLSASLPAIGKVRMTRRRMLVQHGGTRTMLALELFRGRTGHYPERLEELVPGDIGALPEDPFGTGALRYRRNVAEGGTAAGGYVLYSVGADGVDNGGKQHPAMPMNAMGSGPAGRGYDFVVNLPRNW